MPSEISNRKLIEAEEKKEIIVETQPLSKTPNIFSKFVRHLWYKRSVTDEEDNDNQIIDDRIEKKILALDINTTDSTNKHKKKHDNKNKKTIEQKESIPIPSWINDQVYGDKVSLL